ncbi:hypothetical protein Tco_0674083 [Tanacetum coccineum]
MGQMLFLSSVPDTELVLYLLQYRLTSGDKSLDLSSFKLFRLFLSLLSLGTSSCWRSYGNQLRILKVIFQTEDDSNVEMQKISTDDLWLNKLVGKGKFIGHMDDPIPNQNGTEVLCGRNVSEGEVLVWVSKAGKKKNCDGTEGQWKVGNEWDILCSVHAVAGYYTYENSIPELRLPAPIQPHHSQVLNSQRLMKHFTPANVEASTTAAANKIKGKERDVQPSTPVDAKKKRGAVAKKSYKSRTFSFKAFNNS